MNRIRCVALRFAAMAAAAILLCCHVSGVQAQMAAPTTPATQAPAQEATPAGAPADAGKSDEDRNPFAPAPAPPLPAGMTGSNASDPRFSLTPGLYDAGESSMGMKHLLLVKKPEAFQLGTDQPDDPKVQKTIGQLGIGGGMVAKMPKELQLVIAQLAFSNSDLAFQGNHLFQGNFYGINIYDISDPSKAAIVTSMVCPGGQGDVSVYKNLLFMSVEMPNGRLDCGTQGFPAEPPPPPPAPGGRTESVVCQPRRRDRFRGVRIFDISDIQNPKQVAGGAQTCRGSHYAYTILVVDPER